MKVLIKRILIFFMWYPLRIFIRVLPLDIIYLLGIAGGRLLRLISKEKTRVMAGELKAIFPQKSPSEIETIIRGSFENYCLSEMEVLLYPCLNKSFIEKMVVIEGREHLDAALKKGKGVALFQAHFGAFQMTMPAIGYSGYTMSQISASAALWKDGNPASIQARSFDIKARYEYTLPVKHISIQSSLRPAFRALENNEVLGITVDGGGGRKVVPIRFLGRIANFQQGGADMAIRTGAEIVPAFIITEKGLKHRLIISPPIKIDEKLGGDENIKNIMKEFAGLLEGYVNRFPSHYGYSLYLRKERSKIDPYPFFADHGDGKELHGRKGMNYA
ncbi:MAG: lysophospholipid acyltransferase family protein [Deltaproteobacteria bacterium]|nr:lysophospholipid acyltransferase family protein [Deltaproteobacteria bacterium]